MVQYGAPSSLRPGRAADAQMRVRFEDAEDKRLSKGGSGGRYGKNAAVQYAPGSREAKVEAYLNNDLPSADGTITKIIAGSMLFTLLALLMAVYMYYGADGLVAATEKQRAVRGI